MNRRWLWLCLLPFLLAGCWDRIEVDEQAFVLALGIDQAEAGYLVTAQVMRPKPSGGGGGNGGGGGQESVWHLQGTGDSPVDALRSMNAISQRALNLSHVRVLFFGEEVAREDIRPMLDVLTRLAQLRPSVWLAVSEGRAADAVLAQTKAAPFPALGRMGYQGYSQDRYALILATRIHEAIRALNTEGRALVLPRASVEPAVKEGPGDIPPEVKLEGGALFRGAHMVRWLDKREIRGILWVRGEAKHTFLVAPCPDRPDKKSAFGLDRIHVNRWVAPEGAQLEVRVRGEVSKYSCEAPLNTLEAVRQLEEAVAGVVKAEVEEALAISRETGTDLFGLGFSMYRQRPWDWLRVRSQWPDRLADLPVTVEVEAQLPRTGMIRDRIR